MNQIIYKQGDPVTNVYVVSEGTFEVVRTNVLKKEDDKKRMAFPPNVRRYLGPYDICQSQDLSNNFPLNKKKRNHKLKVSLIDKNQVFGQEDAMNDRNYTTTVKCISNRASIFYCKSAEFYNIIKRDDKSWDVLAY